MEIKFNVCAAPGEFLVNMEVRGDMMLKPALTDQGVIFMKEKHRKDRILRASALVSILLLSACASPGKLLEDAERSWSMGLYTRSIEEALQSYEKAVEKNKDQNAVDNAKNFLVEKFPQFNENQSRRAENQLKGTNTDKETAWKTYQQLVEMNSLIGDSIASGFLETQDFTAELQNAKEVAAEIKYNKSLELIGQDVRAAYMEAATLLRDTDYLVPGYRDADNLLKTCLEKGTLTIAFSRRSLNFNYNTVKNSQTVDISDEMRSRLEAYIGEYDVPEFLNFISTDSAGDAGDAGAVLFLEIQGDVWIASSLEDSYIDNGTISWQRGYEGMPNLIVTRIADFRNEVAAVPLKFSQSISIEFYPVKYNTESLSSEMYADQFNNFSWMDSQLQAARDALEEVDASSSMIIWAEMQYGGTVNFLKTALVDTAEGEQELSMNEEVYAETESFINSSLPDFLEYRDFDLEERISAELFNGFTAEESVRKLLTDLEG